MIAFLRGKVASLEPSSVILDCGGVGYKVHISLNTYDKIQGKQELTIQTYHLVREDAQLLFGFAKALEKQLFELLLGISGVGASTAITILSSMNAGELSQAIAAEDVASLKRVKGIGAKTAGRIVLELKDKLGAKLGDFASGLPSLKNTLKDDAVAGLQSLGFSKNDAEKEWTEF
ncbi:MAG: Holliday junction branch migration protein RuvA [Bacteroidia bacterium]